MYCTLNTHKLDVDKVLGREIGLNDFLFAHVKSQPKEIRIQKGCEAFGMTLTDTGCGVVFIKRLQPGGMMAFASQSCGGMIEIGDQIEKINNVSFIGRRHYEVAAYLKSIPVGATFLLRLVSPEKSPICE
ncbi:PDZ domain-containing protein GIPC1 [Fasciola gigantica]|uniref:PDZ domain-containing protein GIPC1 n=1 Tax=Fasciola gigantica TaxID=46835 RepID=A0A504YC07_FASGI|nr:PDZ domain-containing protein GIPC1 [Fasciola gigantica]